MMLIVFTTKLQLHRKNSKVRSNFISRTTLLIERVINCVFATLMNRASLNLEEMQRIEIVLKKSEVSGMGRSVLCSAINDH